MQGPWKETMAGGSPEAERAEFDQLARDIMLVQLKNAKTASAHGVPHRVDRAFHAKSDPRHRPGRADLPRPARRPAGGLRPARPDVPGRRSGSPTRQGTGQPDTKPDLRGVALRVQVSPEESHDLLMTNFPVSHARNARQFVEFAKATAGSPARHGCWGCSG